MALNGGAKRFGLKKHSKITVWVWQARGQGGVFRFSDEKPQHDPVNVCTYKLTQEELDIWLDVQAEYAVLQENLQCILKGMFKPV